MKHMLDAGGDPGKIQVGQHLFIPRSKEGYDKLLKKMAALKEGLAASGDSQIYGLEGMENQYKGDEVLFDLAGDVATMLGSLGAKAFEVARLREGAVGLKGAERFAHEIRVKEAVEDLAEATSATELGKAALDGAAGAAANKMEDEEEAEHLGGARVADKQHKAEYLRKSSTFVLKTAPKAARAGAALQSRMKLGPALGRSKGDQPF